MKFKRLSLVCLFLTLVSSYAWAEKYEYVRLVSGMSFDLDPGDVAVVVAASSVSGFPTDNRLVQVKVGDNTYNYRISEIRGDYYSKPGPLAKHRLVGGGIVSYKDEGMVTFQIERASQTGSKTLAWNGNDRTKSSNAQQANNNLSSPVPDPNGIKYDSLLGWVWFTDTPWMYSYTNGSWYYMRSSNDGIYVWNANLPNSGWLKLRG